MSLETREQRWLKKTGINSNSSSRSRNKHIDSTPPPQFVSGTRSQRVASVSLLKNARDGLIAPARVPSINFEDFQQHMQSITYVCTDTSVSLPRIGGSTRKSARPAYAFCKQQSSSRLPIYPPFMYPTTVRLGAGLLNRASYTHCFFFLSDRSSAYPAHSFAKASRRTPEKTFFAPP